MCVFGVIACYESAQIELDTGAVEGPGTSVIVNDSLGWDSSVSNAQSTDSAVRVGETSDPDTAPATFDTAEMDTLFSQRESHYCDSLGWDDCRDATAECGRMYLVEVQHVRPNGVAVVCDGESLFYGCAPLKYCYEDIFLALDPDGRCWLMSKGCLPNEPGWRPSLDDVLCAPPIWSETCVE
ncbi:MAG: hypothetical protein JXX14_01650 [Deltaproteobacteria bacterium]|nr:hypothetical protein [Deltaproteobacteria bacterium]